MFIRGENPIWFFNNLTGESVDDTYYAFFLENDLPYLPQNVYQDPNGINPWSNPIEFQPSGGLPNNLYFDPDLVYRIEIRQGPTQVDPLIYLIEDYVLSSEGGGGGNNIALLTAENMITNPQFADLYFVSPLTLTTAGTYDIGPGWKIVLTGNGSTTLTHFAITGASNPLGNGNPSYYLQIASGGWSSVKLIQTFSNNPAIFGGGAVAIAFDAAASTTSQTINVSYQPSNGAATTILNQVVPVGDLLPYTQAVDIPKSTSIDSGVDSFVNIVFTLPASGTVLLSNIQLTGQSVPLPTNYSQTSNPLFQELTYERIVDHEFHVYKDSLVLQAKDNLLTGWTFALNPWQFRSKTISNVANNTYTADQTILVQQAYVASATANNVSVGQGTAAQKFGYVVQAVTANNQFAIIQYIDSSTIAPYWGEILSAMVNISLNSTHGSTVLFKAKLIWRSTLPSAVSQTEPISAWTAGSDPSFAAGWTTLSPLNDPSYTLTTSNQNFSFDKFQLPVPGTSTVILGIVIYTVSNMNQAATADQVVINRVSLVPNDFAIDASPETFDETLRKCRFYYEKSYQLADLAGAATTVGIKYHYTYLYNDNTDSLIYKNTFQIDYMESKRIAPTVTFYAPDGTLANVRLGIYDGNGTNTYPTPDFVTGYLSNPINVAVSGWSNLSNTIDRALYRPTGSMAALIGIEDRIESLQGEIYYHYIADARLGV